MLFSPGINLFRNIQYLEFQINAIRENPEFKPSELFDDRG